MLVELKVPEVGESITEVEIAEWLKSEGARVEKDENVAVLETDKATLELPAPVSGTVTKLLKQQGERAAIGDTIAQIEEQNSGKQTAEAKAEESNRVSAPATVKVEQTETTYQPPIEEATREERQAQETLELRKESDSGGAKGSAAAGAAQQAYVAEPHELPRKAPTALGALEEIVPMNLLRRRIAERLVQAQNTAALLTTFNEIDMAAVIALRRQYGERFQAKHKAKLGFMSFFVKASIEALKRIPQINAEIRGTDIVYRRYYDIGIAVGGGRGLVVPVLRQADRMSFAEIEAAIGDFALRAQNNKLTPEELQGGTFTISNGGIYGSLLSTPIVNPPQSAILGLHAIQERPVARDGNIVVRPMMYAALTYDHRIIDGREAVTFLKHIKEIIEDPARILLEL